jgi:hypothetical protein
MHVTNGAEAKLLHKSSKYLEVCVGEGTNVVAAVRFYLLREKTSAKN